MKQRPLLIYLLAVTILSGGFIGAMLLLGQKALYLAQFYMLGPALAALITRLWFYEGRFKDAAFKWGKPKQWLIFWGAGLGVTALSYALMTLFGTIGWDLNGDTFLDLLSKQMDINALPPGFTPQMMLLLYFIGGLTVFNIPGIITGFGEEFGWRGLMFPLLYKIRPWVGFIIGGLIWFAWHIPLVFVFPSTTAMTALQQTLNIAVLGVGSIATFALLAYVYVKTGSIFVVSFAHIVLNNSARSFSYFVSVNNQLTANVSVVLASVIPLLILHFAGELNVFKKLQHENDSVSIDRPSINV